MLYIHDQEKKLSSFGFKATFGGPEQDPKISQSMEWGNTFSGVLNYNGKGKVAKYMYARKQNLAGMFNWLWTKSIVCTELDSSSNNKNRSAFNVSYFRDSRNFNYAMVTPEDLIIIIIIIT